MGKDWGGPSRSWDIGCGLQSPHVCCREVTEQWYAELDVTAASCVFKNAVTRAYLVVQWLRTCLAMQQAWVRPLIGEPHAVGQLSPSLYLLSPCSTN